MPYDEDISLETLRDQLAEILEARTTELLAEIKATQLLAAKIASAEEDIARYRAVRGTLEAELANKTAEAARHDR